MMEPQVWGYVADFDQDGGFASARDNLGLLSGLSLVRCFLGESGELIEYPGITAVPDWIRASSLSTACLVANQIDGRWNRGVVANAIGEPRPRREHIEDLTSYAMENRLDGIEIDYEELGIELRDSFSQFIAELANALHGRGKQLAVAVHAKEAEPGESDGALGQDWASIGASADRVAVMAYDFDPTNPGPISPLGWVRNVLGLARTCIPPEKLIQGIPQYGYLWSSVDRSPAYLTYREFSDLAVTHSRQPRRDPIDQHLFLEYQENDAQHQAWIADSVTATTLAAIGREFGVAGYAIWRLGSEQSSSSSSPQRGPFDKLMMREGAALRSLPTPAH